MGGFDPKPDAKCMSSVLMGCVWGEVDARGGKNKWGKAGCVLRMWRMGGKVEMTES